MTELQRRALRCALDHLDVASSSSVTLFAKAGTGGDEERCNKAIGDARSWLEAALRDAQRQA